MASAGKTAKSTSKTSNTSVKKTTKQASSKKASTSKAASTKKAVTKKASTSKVASTKKPVTKKAASKKPASSETKSKTNSKTKSQTKPKAKSKTFVQTDASDSTLRKIDPEHRRRMIAETSYFIAERRGFVSGSPTDDWLEAEVLVDRLLEAGEGGDGASTVSPK